MRLCIGIPVVGAVDATVFHALLASVVPLAKKFELVIPACYNTYPHAAARNHIIDDAIKHGCDYLYFLDSDMFPHCRSAEVLLKTLQETGGVMVSGHAYRRGYPYTSVWTKVKDGQAWQVTAPMGVQAFEIDSTGLACNMIDLAWVVQNLETPYFKQGSVVRDGKIVEMYEDAWFCMKILEAGGKIFADPNVRCGHLASATVVNDYNADYLRQCVIKANSQDVEQHDSTDPVLSEVTNGISSNTDRG